MVASTTRLLFVAWFACLGALVFRGMQTGWQAGTCIGLYLLVLGHPTLLALELALARLVDRRTNGASAERVPAWTLVRAWAGEWRASVAVFGWRLPWRANAVPDHLPRSSRGLRGVVFVHGFVCNRGVWNPWLARLRRLDRAFVAVNLEPVFADIDDYAEAIGRAVQRVERVTGLAPVIVAHSMGGLAVRAWLRTRAGHATSHGHEHAARVITIGTPHRGTWLARVARSRNGRQMRVGSAWVASLAVPGTPDHRGTFTSWWSACDQIVFPPPCAVLPGSESRHLRGSGHLQMLEREEVWAEIRRRIDR
ncbi:MAG TPA: permease [Burkholderiaceae bacterium]